MHALTAELLCRYFRAVWRLLGVRCEPSGGTWDGLSAGSSHWKSRDGACRWLLGSKSFPQGGPQVLRLSVALILVLTPVSADGCRNRNAAMVSAAACAG